MYDLILHSFNTELSLDNLLRIKSNFCRHSFKTESLKVEACSHSFVSATSCKSGQTLQEELETKGEAEEVEDGKCVGLSRTTPVGVKHTI